MTLKSYAPSKSIDGASRSACMFLPDILIPSLAPDTRPHTPAGLGVAVCSSVIGLPGSSSHELLEQTLEFLPFAELNTTCFICPCCF